VWLCAALSVAEETQLEWIIGKPFEDGMLSKYSHLTVGFSGSDTILEFGPR